MNILEDLAIHVQSFSYDHSRVPAPHPNKTKKRKEWKSISHTPVNVTRRQEKIKIVAQKMNVEEVK